MEIKQKIKINDIVPHQNNVKYSKKGGYKTKRLSKYENDLNLLLIPFKCPDNQPLFLVVTYYYPIPKSWNMSKKMTNKGNWKTTTPDITDNLNKPFVDALSKKLNFDDKMIVKFESQKLYNDDIDDRNNYIEYEISECEKIKLS